MVMTYSASVLVTVVGGEHEGNAFFPPGATSEWLLKLLQCSGMASQAVTMGPLGIPLYLLTFHCTKIVVFDI